MAPTNAHRTQPQNWEGIAVVGEAVRRVAPESAEFLVEIAASGPTVSQAMTNHQNVLNQIAQAVSAIGVHRGDLQTVSMNVANVFTPALGVSNFGFPQIPQLPQAAFPGFTAQSAMPPHMQPAMQPNLQPDIQFGSYQAKSTLRVTVREIVRAGEIVDTLMKAGANLVGGITYRPADEAGARRAVLEAAGKDARAKAESLAASTGKELGDPSTMTEEVVASNGVYSAMRMQMPWAFGPNMPAAAGELEYYARVTASFRFQ